MDLFKVPGFCGRKYSQSFVKSHNRLCVAKRSKLGIELSPPRLNKMVVC